MKYNNRYQVVCFKEATEAEAINALCQRIDELLSAGWRLSGGICVIKDANWFRVYQAVTRDYNK